jgi:acyl-coenzyme A synthetase/AMP-(fatty) acid ligase
VPLVYTGEQPPPRFNMARYCIGRAAAATPDKIALIVVSDAAAPLAAAETWTYRALDDAVRRVAAGLLGEGLKPGDRLMIRMPNTSDYVLMVFGAIAAGIVPVPSSAQLTETEAAFLLTDSDAAALAAPAALALPDARRLLDEAAVARIRQGPPLADYADTAAADPAFLLYTSGTSRRPKGVLHGHRSAWGRKPMYADWVGIGPKDRMLHAGAFNWTYTFGVGITDPWANGATAILYNGPKDITVWPRLLEATQATLFAAVPSLFRQVLKYCDLSRHDLSALRHGLAAGEALSPNIADDWRRATGLELYEAFGMSECSTFVSMRPGEPVRPGSFGKPQRGRAIAVLPLDGGTDPLPPGEIGLLAIHRDDPGLMLGYWRRPDEDGATTRGDWFISGDLAALDADGYLWHKGRADDVMNAGGFRVSPLEVEAALAGHPSVAEVAVADRAIRPDVRVIVAFVIAREGAARDAGSILAHAADTLAPYKRPREIVFVETLPRSANGKLLRRALPEILPTRMENQA